MIMLNSLYNVSTFENILHFLEGVYPNCVGCLSKCLDINLQVGAQLLKGSIVYWLDCR